MKIIHQVHCFTKGGVYSGFIPTMIWIWIEITRDLGLYIFGQDGLNNALDPVIKEILL